MADESRIVKDPICGKDVDTLRARAVGIFGGVTYYFCSADCKAKYRDPRQQGSAEWTGVERRAEPKPPPPRKQPAEVGANVKQPAAELEMVEEPRRRPLAAAAAAAAPARAAAEDDDAALETPARRGIPWIAVVLTLLMAAGAVLLFTLRK